MPDPSLRGTCLFPGTPRILELRSGMRTKKYRPITLGLTDDTREREVQREIDKFLLALQSYPQRFADDPALSFEEYLYSVIASDLAGRDGQHKIN